MIESLTRDLESMVSCASVGALVDHQHDLRYSADLIAQMLRDVGCPDVQVLEDPYAPAIVGRFPPPPGAPTICFYAHHDVQPIGDPHEWEYPPFELMKVGGRLFGRGTADDKGAIAVHLEMLRAFDGNPPVGVTIFVEGEEEIGSPNIASFLHDHQDLIRADAFVILDSVNWAQGEPSYTVALRGVCDAIIEIETLDHPVHSGQFGGVLPDALTTLCRLLASFHTESGECAIEGIQSHLSFDVDYDRDSFRSTSGLLDGVHELGEGTLADRLWAQPSVTVIGLDTTSVEQSSNTLLPTARARVSMRVPPGMEANQALDLLVAHCEKNVPWGAHLRVIRGNAGDPAQVDTDGPLVQAGIRAHSEAFGRPPVIIGQGGAIPLVHELRELFPEAEFLITAICDPDSRMHGPNESVSLQDMIATVEAQVGFLKSLAENVDEVG